MSRYFNATSGNAGVRRGRLLAAAVAASLLAGAGSAAAITVTGEVEGLDVAEVQQCGTVGLTVKLPLGNPFDQVAPGKLPPGPAAGTVFTVKRIDGIDLTTTTGWQKAADMSVERALDAPSTLTKTAVTDATGTAVIAGLPVGLYLVTAVTPQDPAYAKTAYAPMLVTLPTGGVGESGATGTWNCAPVVYAKPTTESPTTPPTPPTTPPERPTTAPSTPGKPPATSPSTPKTTPKPPPAAPPGPGSPGGKLPLTGVSVLALVGAAIAAAGVGLLMTRIGKKGPVRHEDR